MTRALIVADPQRDFCEGGSLGVTGGAAAVSRIDSLLKSDHGYTYLIASRDHHIDPGLHFAAEPDFVDSWPPHCVVGSPGSEFHDNLTFRVAQPNDLWMHAGDYPGSHVVVRNPTRKEIPHRTIIEAAQLAGRFSQASEDTKVVVHYTERKFLSKPKRAAPGLVRMSRFRSITIEPKESVSRL